MGTARLRVVRLEAQGHCTIACRSGCLDRLNVYTEDSIDMSVCCLDYPTML